ncbi:uncharacterized protein LOC132199401 [Neocloeon triangulifer]|uniref:uncharacterized protein LOC132199401 n=1 Tax=Neocloeon triangulifer TaxID=2078957 RepID=UPI00286EBCC5|nr:uncharacterized protein LOC132199401 [Neocloeon triangulifer]
MKCFLIFIFIVSTSTANALFLPYIFRALGIEQTPAPVTTPLGARNAAQNVPATPAQPAFPQRFYAQQPSQVAPLQTAPQRQQALPSRFAIFQTQQLVESPYRGYVLYNSYLLPQVQAEIPIHPGETQKVDEKEIENAPIIVGSGYALHPSE